MLFIGALGFIVGIALSSLFHVSYLFFIILAVVCFIIFVYKYFVEEVNHKTLFSICVFLLCLGLGVGRVFVSNLYSTSHLEMFTGRYVSVEGVIVDEPDVREKNTQLTVKIDRVTLASTTTSVKEKILITTSIYPDLQYGDRVRANVTLKEPENINSNGRVFDYKGYLKVRGIWYTADFTKVTLLSHGHGSLLKTELFKIKNLFTSAIENALPEPESSLLMGLLLGAKQSLGKEWLLKFQKTGTSHIVVLSGYNIAVVAKSITSALAFLPKTFSFSFGILAIILFTILSGGGASAWRAAIMVLVALFAGRSDRDYKAGRALGFAIVLMLAGNPALLIFDPSFQLSVLATLGLIYVSPIVSPYFKKVPEKFGLREIVSSTVATQIIVLPFLIYTTGILSMVSLPVNILVLGTIPLAMFFGFVTGAVGIVSLYLSFIPALFAYVLLWYELKVIDLGSSLSFSSINLPAFSFAFLVAIYIVIFILLYRTKKLSKVL